MRCPPARVRRGRGSACSGSCWWRRRSTTSTAPTCRSSRPSCRRSWTSIPCRWDCSSPPSRGATPSPICRAAISSTGSARGWCTASRRSPGRRRRSVWGSSAGSRRCSACASPLGSPKRLRSRSTTACWRSVFWFTGLAGIVSGIVWFALYREPRDSRRANAAELELITAGGALTTMAPREEVTWPQVRRLLRERQVWALGLGKYAVMSSLYFLLTWFPTYLVRERGLTSLKAGAATSLPYIAAALGVMLGGFWSDWLLRRGVGISAARKIPIVTGFLGASTIILVNYVEGSTLALTILTIAYFAQGVSGNSWSIIAEVAPKNLMGTCGRIINFTGQIAGIVTPILIGFILRETGSFEWVLVFVSVAGLVGALSYTVLLGRIHRIEI